MCDPPPQMRGLFAKQAKRSVLQAITIALSVGYLFRTFYVIPRSKRMRDYYLDFDPEVSLEYMISQGYMSSSPIDD